ncbi:MAG TPA: hypothetical protein VHE35_35260, partial [Kofleriaceae bacterium]|nr:hypothetical protein [Kofleriaceae bacterium]
MPVGRRRRRWPGRLAMALAGLACGLGVAECMFRIRDHGGFPKLNVYQADPVLGVRLEPGARQRFVYPDNPITTVRINRQGYRGADFPKPGPDDVLVVGDSQVFGLGVEEGQTFSAVLQGQLGGGRAVLNAGVPTYGPDEYVAVARELIAARHPRTVVFTVNLVNDLFEASHPNRDRHVVRDGWAVRKEVAGDLVSFPGRTWLARHSHLFYALRSYWHHETDGQEVASEGSWKDLVALGDHQAEAQAGVRSRLADRAHALRDTEAKLDDANQRIDTAMIDLLDEDLSEEDRLALEAGHKNPGDVVYEPGEEEARSVIVTATQIRRGAILRARLRARFERVVKSQTKGEQRAALLASLADQPKLAARLDELSVERIEAALDSPLAPSIRALKETCDAAGVRLVVLVLPIDVAVSADEWKKYGAAPVDMSSVASLVDELVALGDELGVTVVDATPALRAAEPGAFLVHDIHLTPRGHAAVAAVLARALAERPPVPHGPTAARSPMPLPAQWRAAPEILVAGSTAARCETKQLREWLRIYCLPADGAELDGVPKAITLRADHSHGAYTMVMPRSAALTVALAPGDSLAADFTWTNVTRHLEASWAAKAPAPTAAFTGGGDAKPPERRYGEVTFASDAARAMCGCWHAVYADGRVDSDPPDCPGVYGGLDGCEAYQGDCPRMVACALRDPSAPPRPQLAPAVPAPAAP